jgi:hypothetical protein
VKYCPYIAGSMAGTIHETFLAIYRSVHLSWPFCLFILKLCFAAFAFSMPDDHWVRCVVIKSIIGTLYASYNMLLLVFFFVIASYFVVRRGSLAQR